MDWSGLGSKLDLCAFVGKLIRVRRQSRVLRRDRFVHGAFRSVHSGFADIAWYTPNGTLMAEPDWTNPGNRCLGMLRCAGCTVPESEDSDDDRTASVIYPEPYTVGAQSHEQIDTVLVIFNAGSNLVRFTLPRPTQSQGQSWRWHPLLCSDLEITGCESTDPLELDAGDCINVPADSVFVLDLIG